MTKKANIAITLSVLTLMWLATATDVLGGTPPRRAYTVRQSRAAHMQSRATRVPSATGYRSSLPSPYYDYPKYTGGFHARYFDELPSIYGTRPMRGTAW